MVTKMCFHHGKPMAKFSLPLGNMHRFQTFFPTSQELGNKRSVYQCSCVYIYRERRRETGAYVHTTHNPRAKAQDPRAEAQEPRAKSQDPRPKSQEPRSKTQDPRPRSQGPRAKVQAFWSLKDGDKDVLSPLQTHG